MHSLKIVDKRRLFKATTKLVDGGTQLYSFKSKILSKEKLPTKTLKAFMAKNEWK